MFTATTAEGELYTIAHHAIADPHEEPQYGAEVMRCIPGVSVQNEADSCVIQEVPQADGQHCILQPGVCRQQLLTLWQANGLAAEGLPASWHQPVVMLSPAKRMAFYCHTQRQANPPTNSIRLLTAPTHLNGSCQSITAAMQQTIKTAWTRLTILLATSERVLPWGFCRVRINTRHATAYEVSHATAYDTRLTEVS